nr:MAG TPA_asm: hypothetical protein [Caudoviricetes sp.]
MACETIYMLGKTLRFFLRSFTTWLAAALQVAAPG